VLSRAGHKDGVEYFRFTHRTFLEFFAAQQIAYKAKDGQDLYQRLHTYIEARAADEVCLLAVQLQAGSGAHNPVLQRPTCSRFKLRLGLHLLCFIFSRSAATWSRG
jgi:guanylate kinase